MNQRTGETSLGRKPIAPELRRSERACAMFTKAEMERIQEWAAAQTVPVSISDAIRALVLGALDRDSGR